MIVVLLIAIIVCLMLSFFFSGSETAIISANTFRLREQHQQGDRQVGRLLELLENRKQRLLIMVLIGTNLANVMLALLFKYFVNILWPTLVEQPPILGIRLNEWAVLGIMTPIIVLLAEIVPKALFRARADSLVQWLHPIFLIVLAILWVPIVLIEKLSHLVLLPLSEEREKAVRQLTRQDVLELFSGDDAEDEHSSDTSLSEAISTALDEAAALSGEGNGDADFDEFDELDERDMVQNIIELHETLAEEIMTPLVELVAIPLRQMDVNGFKSVAKVTGFSRFPVFRDRMVNLEGYIDVYEVLRSDDEGASLDRFVEPAYYVPATKPVDDLLQEFLQLRLKLAIIVDEFGGCIGWVTREDILEEIVGDLEDELDAPSENIRELEDGSWLVEARMEIEDVNEAIDAEFSDDEWETLAGLLLHEAGRIPAVGDHIELEDGWLAVITKMDKHRIHEAQLIHKPESDGDEE